MSLALGPGGGFSTLAGLSGLQRGATGISQFGNQMSPEMRALTVAMPALQNILSGTGAASGLDALRPVFQQNLNTAQNKLFASAPGGRFSSGMFQAQGQLGTEALNNFNLTAANMLQEGIRNQIGAAGALGSLGSSAGDAQLRALSLLLGPSLGAAFGGTTAMQPSGLQQGMQAGGSLAQLWLLSQMLNGGGRGMGMPGVATNAMGAGGAA